MEVGTARCCRDCGGPVPRPTRNLCDPCLSAFKRANGLRSNPPTYRDCEWCGHTFRYRGRNGASRYCSRRCSGWASAYAKGHPMESPVPWHACPTCGHVWIRRSNRTYCSRECWPPTVYVPNPRPPVRIDCAVCGRQVTGQGRGRPKRFCSKRCCDRASKLTRRHRMRAGVATSERFTVREIATRDGWRCHICGGRVRQRDATMDHLVPLSVGGQHVRENVALAHRLCNSRRGVNCLPAQLLLVG